MAEHQKMFNNGFLLDPWTHLPMWKTRCSMEMCALNPTCQGKGAAGFIWAAVRVSPALTFWYMYDQNLSNWGGPGGRSACLSVSLPPSLSLSQKERRDSSGLRSQCLPHVHSGFTLSLGMPERCQCAELRTIPSLAESWKCWHCPLRS